MLLRILVGALLIAAGPACSAWGLELTPFAVRNFSPPALVHGLAAAEPARLHRPGRLAARLDLGIASNARLSREGDEAIRLDGETYVTTLGLRYGIGQRLQVGIDLPWINHSRGSLDSFIRNWHKIFGLPNGDRNQLPDDQLTYAYAAASGEVFHLDDTTSGPGDLRLLLAWQWLADQQLAVSLHGTLKAPTGDADDLTGSGAWDASLALSAQRDFPLARGSAAFWGGFGATWLGDGDLLSERTEDWAASAWLGTGWSPLDWLGFKLQLDGHSALYDSSLNELGDPALILTLGGSLGLGEATTLDIGVGEDLAVNASPDVTFHVALSHRF